MSYSLQITNLSKSFGSEVIFDSLNLAIENDKKVALIGASGAGKTTLLRIIAGFEEADSGDISIINRKVLQHGKSVVGIFERKVGIVFQDFALFPHMSVRENIKFGAVAENIVDEMLKLTHLEKFQNHLPQNLSGGQQQRVALARTLAMKPRILVLDEPFSNVDGARKKEIMMEMKSILSNFRCCVILVTHDIEDAIFFGEKIFVLEDKKILQEGTARDLYNTPKSKKIAQMLGDSNFLPVEKKIDVCESEIGLINSYVEISTGNQVLLRPEDIEISKSEKKEGYKIVDVINLIRGNLYFVALSSGNLVKVLSIEEFEIGDLVELSLRDKMYNIF